MKSKAFLPTVIAMVLLLGAAPLKAESLRQRIDSVLDTPNLADAKVSIRVVEAETGRVLYSYHADEALIPASNAKIITTAAALDALGSDFELSTSLAAKGRISNGVLEGDLVLIGRGDPSISEHFQGDDVMGPLKRFAGEAYASGIRKVTGDIVADDSYFDREFWCPSWKDNQWILWYQAPVAALAFNDNCVDVTVSPGESPGAPAVVTYFPAVGYVRLTNSVKTTSLKSKHGFGFNRRKTDNNVTAKGFSYVKGGPFDTHFTVYDPSLYLATGLKKALADAGVEVSGTVRLLRRDEATEVDSAHIIAINRVTLGDAVRKCNVNSQNLYAEMLFKTIGREVAGEGSFAGGAKAAGRYLEKLGILPGTYILADGSGLSRETRLSAMTLTEVLRNMYASRELEAFRDSLPLAGHNGTMENRLTEPEYIGRVRAKTGYIMGVSALSGYARASNDKVVAFSIILNGYKGSNRWVAKPIQDDICRAIIESAP